MIATPATQLATFVSLLSFGPRSLRIEPAIALGFMTSIGGMPLSCSS